VVGYGVFVGLARWPRGRFLAPPPGRNHRRRRDGTLVLIPSPPVLSGRTGADVLCWTASRTQLKDRVLDTLAARGPARPVQRSTAPTGQERTFGADELIVSKTDPRGVITYANDVFLRVSGYVLDEVVGRPHNLIRHPEMPKAVFKLLWDTLRGCSPRSSRSGRRPTRT
jgi:PAS domain-containing protein